MAAGEVTRAFGILGAITVEAVVILLLCWWGGERLDVLVPIRLKWGFLLFPIGFFVLGFNVYRMFNLMLKKKEK